jgi:hypothetical protein
MVFLPPGSGSGKGADVTGPLTGYHSEMLQRLKGDLKNDLSDRHLYGHTTFYHRNRGIHGNRRNIVPIKDC